MGLLLYDDFVMIMVPLAAIVRWIARLPGLGHADDINRLLAGPEENADTQMPPSPFFV